jgi:hypothetical protein
MQSSTMIFLYSCYFPSSESFEELTSSLVSLSVVFVNSHFSSDGMRPIMLYFQNMSQKYSELAIIHESCNVSYISDRDWNGVVGRKLDEELGKLWELHVTMN